MDFVMFLQRQELVLKKGLAAMPAL